MYRWNVNHVISKNAFLLLPNKFFRFLYPNQVERFRLGYIQDEYNFLMKSQWFNLKEMERFQLKKLKKFVQYSYRNIPFYKRKFRESGITPYDINSLKDLVKIPIINKDIVRRNFSSILSPNCSFYKIFSTSGSTGKPFMCPSSFESVKIKDAILQRLFSWTGCDPGKDKIMGILRPLSIPGSSISPHGLVFRSLKYLLKNQIFWTPTTFTVEEIFRIFQVMAKFEPKLIHTIPNALHPLIKATQKYDIDFPNSLRYVSLGGEPIDRKKFQKRMNAEIFVRYGASDVAQYVANECKEHSGLHVNMENHIVEIVKDGEVAAEGEKGDVVITDFNNFDAPLMRYDIEDIAQYKPGKCSCGRELRRLEMIYGRKTDLLISTNGKLVTQVEWFFQALKGIEHFRIIQNKIDKIDVLIVPTANYSEETEKQIISILTRHLGNDINVNIKLVKKIPHGQKFRFIISKIGPKYF